MYTVPLNFFRLRISYSSFSSSTLGRDFLRAFMYREHDLHEIGR